MPKMRVAKLNMPRSPRAMPRPRVTEAIGQRRAWPVLWVSGPPGAGKTTAISLYVESRSAFPLWYRLDPGDSDPATFFHFFGELVAARCPKTTAAPPTLGPEHLGDLAAFSRRYFRAVIGVLPKDAILVFDDYNAIGDASESHLVFATLVDEVPEDLQVVVISRARPPLRFARPAMCGRIAWLDWEDLRLDTDEACQLAAARGVDDRRVAAQLLERCDGWVAGFTLLLERSKRDGAELGYMRPDGPELVHDYFESVLLQSADVATTEVLLRTALLPRITPALCEAVTGDPAAIRVVERLYARQLFTMRSVANGGESYRYHALLREFLRVRAHAALSQDERDRVLSAAALALEHEGEHDDALALHAERADWAAVERLLLSRAPHFIAAGRWQTFQDWAALLPEGRLRDNPYLLLWVARARVYVDGGRAMPLLETAYRAFEQRNDGVGQVLASAAALEALACDFDDFVAMDPWIDRIAGLLAERCTLARPDDELHVLSALLAGAVFRRPGHESAADWARRIETLLQAPLDNNLRVGAATVLHGYYHATMDPQVVHVAATARTFVGSPGVTPRMAGFYWAMEAYSHYLRADYPVALECFDRAEALAVEHDLAELALHAGTWRGLCERRAGLLDAAGQTIARLSRLPPARSGLRNAALQFLIAVVEFDRGNADLAARHGRVALNAFVQCGQYMSVVQVGVVVANILVAAERLDEAEQVLAETTHAATCRIGERYLAVIELNLAWAAHKRGDRARRDALLRRVLVSASGVETPVRLHWFPNALGALLPVALEAGYEQETARRLARTLRVVPETRAVAWPWPVKLYTLGGFRVLVDGQALRFSRKAPRKALLLVKALIGFGAEEVPEHKIIDLLWPDEEGDAAYAAFAATVHRVRVLFGDKAALRQMAGRVWLDPARCWVDLHEFDTALDHGSPEAMARGLSVYRGPYLAGEDDLSWAGPTRERARVRYVQAALRVGAGLEADGAIEAAAVIYERAVGIGEAADALLDGLTRCYRQLGRAAEADDLARRRMAPTSAARTAVPVFAANR